MEMLPACSARALAFVNDCPDNFRDQSTDLGSRPRWCLSSLGKLNEKCRTEKSSAGARSNWSAYPQRSIKTQLSPPAGSKQTAPRAGYERAADLIAFGRKFIAIRTCLSGFALAHLSTRTIRPLFWWPPEGLHRRPLAGAGSRRTTESLRPSALR